MKMNRRTFIATLGAVSAACASGGCMSMSGATSDGQDGAPRVDVGTLADYPRDGVTDFYAHEHEVLVIRRGDRVFAMSATCTHQNCIVRHAGSELRCPCHGSRFDLDGNATHGPAKERLVHFAISNENGRLIVDKTEVFSDLSDPASFVSAQSHPSTGVAT